jgi:hypothetical protein
LILTSLGLPADTEILSAEYDWKLESVDLTVSHPFLQEMEPGCPIPFTLPDIRQALDKDGDEFIWFVSWGDRHDEIAERPWTT